MDEESLLPAERRRYYVRLMLPLPNPYAVWNCIACLCTEPCMALPHTNFFKALVRGARWASVLVSAFMLLPGIVLLAHGAYVPVLYSVLALFVLPVMVSLLFQCSAACTDVDPNTKDYHEAVTMEFAQRLTKTACCLAFTAFIVGALVLGIGAEYGYIKPYH